MSKPIKYCWDTCVFIAWMAQEQDKPLADIEVVVEEINSGKAVLIVPVTVYIRNTGYRAHARPTAQA